MTMRPRSRSSSGLWSTGAVACFLVLSIIDVADDDASTVRVVYLAMAAMGR